MARSLTRSEELTKRQRQILEYIVKEIRTKGYPPSVREIGEELDLSSSSTVHSHLKALERKGYLRRDPTKPRAIEVFDVRTADMPIPVSSVAQVPVLGRIAAGQPLLAAENIEDTYPLPKEFAADETFILRVTGDSMIDAGILDGDFIIVKKQESAKNGDIVVAMLEDEATVKRFYRERGHIRLQPENAALAPILATDVSVIGLVVGLLRKIRH